MNFIFGELAKRDLRWFVAYYSKIFTEGRKKAELSLTLAIELLVANPFAGNVVDGKPARQFSVLRSPFVLIYTVERDTINILRVWDGRADPVRLNEK